MARSRSHSVAPSAPAVTEKRDAAAAPGLTGLVEQQLGWVIAHNVRRRRQELELSVAQLAVSCGLSKGMLSKLENAQALPSLTTVARLAEALDMPVTSLFRGISEEREAVFIQAGQGPETIRQGSRAGHHYRLLGSVRNPFRQIEPLLVSLTEPSEVFPLFQHPGIEFIHLLEGVLEYGHGRQRYLMHSGDSLEFEGEVPHGPTELVSLPIRFLSITFNAKGD